jgi:hypothetical protein
VVNRSWIRRTARVAALLVAAALLAGCVDVGLESQFNADGSARYTVIAAIDKSALDQLGQIGGIDTTIITNQDQARQIAEQNGLEYEPIDTPDQTGAKFSKTAPDSSDVGAAITGLFNTAQPQGADAVPAGTFVGTFTQDESSWNFNLTIDTDAVMQALGAQGNALITPSVLDLTYTATFPGSVEDTNGTKLSNTQVQWNLPLSGSTTLTANGNTDSGGSSSIWLIVAIVAGGLILAGVIAAYLLATRRRTTPALEAAAPGAVAPVPSSASSVDKLADGPPASEGEQPDEDPANISPEPHPSEADTQPALPIVPPPAEAGGSSPLDAQAPEHADDEPGEPTVRVPHSPPEPR